MRAVTMTALDVLRSRLAGVACVVLGSAPLSRPIHFDPDTRVVAVNGGISSYPRCDVWVLNARARTDVTVAGYKGRLHRLMVQQGAGRDVALVALLSRADGGADHMRARLVAQGTRAAADVEINQAMRPRLEAAAGVHAPTKHAISAGLFAVVACVAAGAATVRLEGFSWQGGYHYLPGEAVSRSHLYDKVALAQLLALHGDRVTCAPSLVTTQKEHSMAKSRRPSRTVARDDDTSIAHVVTPREGPRRVVATELTYYNHQRRRPGDTFDLRTPTDFRASCMEDAPADAPLSGTTPGDAMRAQHADILAGKSPQLAPNAADEIPASPALPGNADVL